MIYNRSTMQSRAKQAINRDSFEVRPIASLSNIPANISSQRREDLNASKTNQPHPQPQSQPGPAPFQVDVDNALPHYVEIPHLHDEYGAELGRDARFWRTYVKETDRWDAELVDGWNRSLDVILTFAALFSAISTAFVLESSKSLQQDQAKSSAETLRVISRTLLLMLNGTETGSLPAASSSIDGNFRPSWSAICVNALWFLSLGVSVSVSLVAMLAKEWCYSFMSGRTGQPCLQARRRQQLWDGLVHWKMRELLIFLPTLIHLALLLFAIGLSIYLWDIHFGVAIPVLFVTLASVGFYTVSTILPLVHEFCPYGTTISKLSKQIYQAFCTQNNHSGDENPGQDMITSRALRWLIENCEVPRSVDTALQAIAGADKNLPRKILQECNAETLIYQRLTASSSYAGNYDLAVSLYARALAFLKSDIQVTNPGDRQSEISGKVEVSIWAMQSKNESDVTNSLTDSEFIPAKHNLTALRIGSTAASDCLKIFSDKHQGDLGAIVLATSLLEQHLYDQIRLHPAALLSVVKATEILVSCALVHSEPHKAVAFPIKLVRAFVHFSRLPKEYEERIAARSYIGVMLAAFAISQRDYPGWTDKPPLNHISRAERAIEMVGHYASLVKDIDRGTAATLIHFGLFELLSHSETYRLAHEDYEVIARAFALLPFHTNEAIYTLPPPNIFNPSHRILDNIHSGSLLASKQSLFFTNESRLGAYLQAMRDVYNSVGVDRRRIERAYAFVVESLYRVQAVSLRNLCLTIMNRIPFTAMSNELAADLAKRDIIPLLLRTLESTDTSKATFAAGQLWLISTLLLRPTQELNNVGQTLLGPPLGFAEKHNVTEQLELIRDALAVHFEQAWLGNEEVSGPFKPGGVYFSRLLECIIHARGGTLSDPLWHRVGGVLQHVSDQLRGLPS